MDRDRQLRSPARLGRLAGLAVAWVLSACGGVPAQFLTPEPPLAGAAAAPVAPPAPPQAGRESADLPVPVVSLRVRVPARAEPGKELEYHLLVENCSKAAANHVLVRDRLPRGARFVRADPPPTAREPFLTWDLGTLAPCVKKEIVVVILPESGADIENNAYVQFEHGQTVRTLIHRPDLRLRVHAPPRVSLHDAVTFQLEVTNVGLADAADVVLKDEIPEKMSFVNSKPSTSGENPLTWKLGTLRPGQGRSVEFSAASLSPGSFTDRAEVTAAGGLRQEASAYVQVGERLLVVISGPERRLVGRVTTYQVTVVNTGTEPAANVRVVNKLREDSTRDVEFVHATDNGKLVGDTVSWSLDTLQPGARRSVQVAVKSRSPGQFKHITNVTADGGLFVKHGVWTHFEEGSGPVVEIDKGGDPFEVGRPATCRVRIVNSGPAATAGLTVRVPGDWRLLRAGGRSAGRQGAGFVRFDTLPTLAAGEEAEYTLEIQPSKPGPARLRAELTTAAAPTPLVWEETLTAEGK